MNVEFINPFISALLNVLKTMAQTELKPGKPMKKSTDHAHGDVSGLIGMVGPQVKGSFSLSFDESLALEIMHRMLGEHHFGCSHPVQFLICDECGDVREIQSAGLKETLDLQAKEFGFQISKQTIEAHGRCVNCQ